MANSQDQGVELTWRALTESVVFVMRRAAAVLGVSTALLAAFLAAEDLLVPPRDQLGIEIAVWMGFFLLEVIATYWLIRHLLSAASLELGSATAQQIGAFVILSFLTTIAILLGLVLLIIPGLLLAARWTLVWPIIVQRDQSIAVALSRSWQATKKCWGKLFVAQLILTLPIIATMANAFRFEETPDPTLVITAATAVVDSVFYIASVLLTVATYRVIGPNRDRLADIFS